MSTPQTSYDALAHFDTDRLCRTRARRRLSKLLQQTTLARLGVVVVIVIVYNDYMNNIPVQVRLPRVSLVLDAMPDTLTGETASREMDQNDRKRIPYIKSVFSLCLWGSWFDFSDLSCTGLHPILYPLGVWPILEIGGLAGFTFMCSISCISARLESGYYRETCKTCLQAKTGDLILIKKPRSHAQHTTQDLLRYCTGSPPGNPPTTRSRHIAVSFLC